jgi:hypothetical protein
VVAGVTAEALEAAFAAETRRRTRLGGLHLVVGSVPFDVWSLERTWAFQVCPTRREPTFAELARTTFLNVEGVAVELTGPGEGTIHDGGLFEAVTSRTLEINFEPNPSPVQCVVRSLVTAAQLRFAIGPKLARYLTAQGQKVSAEELAEVGRAHYGHLRWDFSALRAWLDALRDEPTPEALSPLGLPALTSPRR